MIIVGDCLQELSDIAECDAVIMDPPYCSGGATEAGRGRSKAQGLRGNAKRRLKWFESDNMTTAGLMELMRSVCVAAPLVDSGSILCFCDWRMAPLLAPAMESAGFRLRNIVVWDKCSFGLGTGFRPRHEFILHLTKRSPKFYSKSFSSVLAHKRVSKSKRQHPTQKPVELLRDLIEVVTPVGGLVVDPFCGSGSTGVACKLLGREFVGIERDAGYASIAQTEKMEVTT